MTAWSYAMVTATIRAATVLLLILVAIREGRTSRAARPDPQWPADLVRLVLSERHLGIDALLPLCGKPDEVHLNRAGMLVPVETKTRGASKVYLSDRIQQSVYAIVLGFARDRRLPHGPGRPVATYGYARVVTPHDTHWKRIGLLTLAQVGGLVRRRFALETGKAEARGRGIRASARGARIVVPARSGVDNEN